MAHSFGFSMLFHLNPTCIDPEFPFKVVTAAIFDSHWELDILKAASDVQGMYDRKSDPGAKVIPKPN